MPDPYVIHVSTGDHCLATWRNVGILIWRRHATRAGVDEALRVYSGLARARPSGVGWLVITEAASTPPDEDVRRLLADAMSKATVIKAMATAQEGQGFHAAVTRLVSASMTVNKRILYPRRIFPSVDDATAWLAATLTARKAGAVEAEELLLAVESLRRRVPR